MADTSHLDSQELGILFDASHQITRSKSPEEVFEIVSRTLEMSSYSSALFTNENQTELLRCFSAYHPTGNKHNPFPKETCIPVREAEQALQLGPIITNLNLPSANLPQRLLEIPQQMDCQNAAYIPVFYQDELHAMLILASNKAEAFSPTIIQSYTNLADTISSTLEKLQVAQEMQLRLQELESISAINQQIASATDLQTLYATLHDQIRQNIGDYDFLVALYHESNDSISIPYLYDQGQLTSIDPFPLGEGLVSIIIRSRQPLMIIENTETRALALGAKVVGKAAKSWMGAPLNIAGIGLGAVIVQDLERERAFTDNNLRFLVAITAQVAGAIYNIHLLDESKRHSLQLETAAEIARDISSSLNLDELLSKAVNLIRERFNFYHASIFLIDPAGKDAVIREATGEAGAQMKRVAHKLGVGSQSIVGFVTGRGESLVVNDTSRDTTHLVNPLLPETRAEAAIPLKIGERIVGAIDIQSTSPYAFTNENLRPIQILADQLAIAVVNTELFAETQEHLSQHRLLHHITTSAASGTTLEEALNSAVNGLQVTLGGDRVSILLLDNEKQALEVSAAVGYSSEDINRLRIPVGTGITGWVAEQKSSVRIDNVSEDKRYISISANTRSELAIPLIFRNELLGVLNVESEKLSAYNDHDEELLGTLGGSLAAIIANARLVEQIRKRVERERLLYEITSKVRRSTDIQTILATTTKELNRVLGTSRTSIKIDLKGNETIPGQQQNTEPDA